MIARLLLLAMTLIFLNHSTISHADLIKKADEAESTGFTDDTVMEHKDDLPFQKVWKSNSASLEDYSEIYIAPINIAYLKENDWWSNLGLKNVEQDIEDMAVYTWDSIAEAFKNDPEHRFTVVDKPGEKTLIMEMALTEMIPNKAGFEAALTTASMGTGAIAVSAASAAGKSFGSKSSVAFEMRLLDGKTNEIVGMLADREQEQASPINIKNFTWHGHSKSIINSWSEQFVKVVNRTPGEVISDTPSFTLKPW